jgi:hypothetical protein
MGPVPPGGGVGKGPVTSCLDLLSVQPGAAASLTALKEALVAIRGAQYGGLEDVFAKYLFAPFYTPPQIKDITDYLHTNWFNETTGWWPAFQPIAPIYGDGLLETLRISLSTPGTPLPIDSYWVIGDGQVQLINLQSPNQVTLLITTPPVPAATQPGLPTEGSAVSVTCRRAGQTPYEINPVTGQSIAGSGLRVQTLKVPGRPRRAS